LSSIVVAITVGVTLVRSAVIFLVLLLVIAAADRGKRQSLFSLWSVRPEAHG
jgi:hypothetical protein